MIRLKRKVMIVSLSLSTFLVMGTAYAYSEGPDYMFEKEGKLTEFEFEVVQEHCFMAKELCEGIPDFQEVEKAFLYHHEK
ncbi:HD domain-containing phosphohydrolase [Paenibacillus sp. V4I7]|nr:HD domain-containing phosphohydrolase [Paenibacillus sp. V4I7]MDQ0902700.1 hypothetical protein [Paenibacillus sp. V4I7]